MNSSVAEAGAAARPDAQAYLSRTTLLIMLLVLAILKLGILGLVGPSIQPDTAAYVNYADAILAHGQAFAPIQWGAEAVPPLIFRLAGYPLVLAAAKLVSPTHFAIVTVLVQIGLNLVAMVVVLRTTETAFRSSAAAMIAVALYAFSGSLLWDNSILSDSLYGSLVTIVIFALIGQLVGSCRLGVLSYAGLGLLWGYSTWLRDSGLYLTFVPLVLAGAVAVRGAGPVPRRAAPLAVFALAVLATTGAYMALNRYRTGVAFFSITGIENWLRPAFDMVMYHYAWPFSDDGIVSRTVRETLTRYDFNSQSPFWDGLHDRCGCTPFEMEALVRQAFLSAVLQHPIAYLMVVAQNFNYLGLGALLADPVATLNQFVELGTTVGHRIIPGLSLRNLHGIASNFSITGALLMTLATVSSTVSAVLFTLFLVGVPWLVVGERRHAAALPLPLLAAALLWFAFVSVSILFSLIHYEARHALPILPARAAATAYMLMRLDEHYRGRRMSRLPRLSPR